MRTRYSTKNLPGDSLFLSARAPAYRQHIPQASVALLDIGLLAQRTTAPKTVIVRRPVPGSIAVMPGTP